MSIVSNFKSKVSSLIQSKKLTSAAVVSSALACTGVTCFAEVSNTLSTDVSTITGITTSVIELFGSYPLNIVLALSLIGGIIGVFRKLRRAAG